MPQPSVAVIVGSLRAQSHNAKLARALMTLGAGALDFQLVKIADLPLFNQDLEGALPEPVQRLKREIETAQGVLVVTPEYNRGVPGVLKNAVDWGSRPYGKNSFKGKPVALAGTSPGAVGTAVAQHQWRSIFAGLDAPVMSGPEIYLQFKDGLIAEDGTVANEDTRKFLRGYMDRFAAFVTRIQG